MQKINIRHLHIIHRAAYPLILFLICWLPASDLLAQSQAEYNQNFNFLNFDRKNYYFGISPLGPNFSDYKITRSERLIGHDSIFSAQSLRSTGINLGIVTNMKIGHYFDIRFLPTLSFVNRRLNYSLSDQGEFDRGIEAVNVEFPVHFRYKSEPYRDMRAYVLGGIKYSFDVASQSQSRQAIAGELVRISPSDFALEIGFGFQFFFEYFIFSPELKYSHGVHNILLYNRDLIYSTTIERIYSRGFTLSFHFEG